MICIFCGEEFEEPLLFEHAEDICPACWQKELREVYKYDGDLIE